MAFVSLVRSLFAVFGAMVELSLGGLFFSIFFINWFLDHRWYCLLCDVDWVVLSALIWGLLNLSWVVNWSFVFLDRLCLDCIRSVISFVVVTSS